MKEKELEDLMLKYLQGSELQHPDRQDHIDNKELVWQTFKKQLTEV